MDVLPIHRGGGEPFNNSPGRHAAASKPDPESRSLNNPIHFYPFHTLTLSHQLKTGIALIQDAFDKKTALLAGELSQWKQTASSLRQEVYSLEKDNKSLQKKVMELEKMCLNQANEIKALTASKSGLHERYLQLKQNAMQLESFRKNIASMVEYGPSVNVLETDQSFVESTDIQEALKKSTNLGRSYQGESGSHPNISERDAPTFMERNPSESQNRNAHDITARSFELVVFLVCFLFLHSRCSWSWVDFKY
ncbi:hypothetical protein BC829DRAFT_392730 [Chytridium lagenaria]|nr:hypothetical protein BC829DRAFT_392730 [Chytridium lagenaria]